MSRTIVVIQKTGRVFAKSNKTRCCVKKDLPKHFGFTSGDNGKIANDGTLRVKGVDYIKYGYPFERRTRNSVRQKVENDLLLDELEELGLTL